MANFFGGEAWFGEKEGILLLYKEKDIYFYLSMSNKL